MKKVIGIISYFPENKQIRNIRKDKLKKLINKCNILFHNTPIMIIAQNWKDDINSFMTYQNLKICNIINKLGIVGARKKLREVFINSDYDYLIMLDDDINLIGDSGDEYLNQIESNPDCFIEFCKSRLNLFAISKEVFKQHDYIDSTPENGEVFEDRVFFYTLCKHFPEKHKKFENTNLEAKNISTGDPNSTWYTNQDIVEMLKNTENVINSYKNGC